MKNTKRILAVVIALTMVIGMFASVSAANPNKKWYSDAVTYLESAGIAEIGMKAETKLTRAEFVLWVAKLEAGANFVESGMWKKDGLDDVIVFSDVDTSVDGIYRSAINYCYQRHFVRGNGDGTFSPDAKVTLAQASAVIVRLMGYENKVTNLEDWQYNYFNVANNYCNAFDKTFANHLPAVDAEYELTYGEAAYLLATILNFGKAPTDPSAIAQLPCLTAEGENLGEKFPAGTLTASSQIAVLSGVDYVASYQNSYFSWAYAITSWTYEADDGLTHTVTWTNNGDGSATQTETWTTTTTEIQDDGEGNPVEVEVEVPHSVVTNPNKKFVTYYTNVIDPSTTATLNFIGETGAVTESKEVSVSDLQGWVRVALGMSKNVNKTEGEIFNLGDYISNGSVLKVKLDVEGKVTSVDVATENDGTRLVSDTFIVAAGNKDSVMKYDMAGNITSYGRYPYLANSNTSNDFTPVLPSSYTDAKKISVSGNKLTLGETTYTIAQTRSVGEKELVVYFANGDQFRGPLTKDEVKAIIPNTAEGEHDVEFTDVDGDGYFDFAVVTEYAWFTYRDYTNGNYAITSNKIGSVGGVVIDQTVTRVTGSTSTDVWQLDSSKATGKIQLVVAASSARHPDQFGESRYYGNKTTGGTADHPGGAYVLPYYQLVDIANLTTAYIESVEKDLVTSGDKTYYVATLVSVADGTSAKVLIPTKAEYADTRTNVKVEIAGQSTTVSVYSADWLPFLEAEEAARENGIDKIVNEENTGSWLVDRTVKYATKGAVSGATGLAADMVCVLLDTTSTAVASGFIVDVKKTETGDNTYNVTVAKSGNISAAEWTTALDIYYTYVRWRSDSDNILRNTEGTNANNQGRETWSHYGYSNTTRFSFLGNKMTYIEDDENPANKAYVNAWENVKAVAAAVAAADATADALALTIEEFDNADATALATYLNVNVAETTVRAALEAYFSVANSATNTYTSGRNNVKAYWEDQGVDVIEELIAQASEGSVSNKLIGMSTGREMMEAMGWKNVSAWAESDWTSAGGTTSIWGTGALWISAKRAFVLNTWNDVDEDGFISEEDTWGDPAITFAKKLNELGTYGANVVKYLKYIKANDAVTDDITLGEALDLIPGFDKAKFAANVMANVENVRDNTMYAGWIVMLTDMIRSGYYIQSKFVWNQGKATATDYGYFTSLITANGATSVSTYEVRASASSLWDYDNFLTYVDIFAGKALKEHEGSTEHVTGYDLTYVTIKRDGANTQYVLQYLDETSPVYADSTSSWAGHDPTDYNNEYAAEKTSNGVDTTAVKGGNNHFANGSWLSKGAFDYQLTTLSAVSYWNQYSSEITLTDIDKELAKITAPGTTRIKVKVATDPYYKKVRSEGDIVSFERHWTVGEYYVTVNSTYQSGDPIKTYLAVVDANGEQIKVEKNDESFWTNQAGVETVDGSTGNKVVATFEVINGLLYRVNTYQAEYKYDANGNKLLNRVPDYNTMTPVEGSTPTDVKVKDDEIVGLIKIEEMTDRKESGYFPGAYKVKYDGGTSIAAGDTPVVVMTPNFKTGDLDGTTTTIEALAKAKAEVFVTYAQVAASGNTLTGGSSLTMLSVIGEFVDKTVAPITETEKTYLVYLAHEGVTIEALENGNFFVVRSTNSAVEIPSCEDFGFIYRKYGTYTEAKYASQVVDLAITTGYYTVKEDGEIVSSASATKNGVITEVDSVGNVKATLDGKKVDATGYKWTFIYEDFEGNLHVAGSATNVSIASKADVLKTLESAEKALATAEKDYADAKSLKLSAEIQATLKAVVDEKAAALETAKTNAIAKYLDGQFWGGANSSVYRYINSYKYTYQKEPSPVTFQYTVIDGTYVVFVNSFFA